MQQVELWDWTIGYLLACAVVACGGVRLDNNVECEMGKMGKERGRPDELLSKDWGSAPAAPTYRVTVPRARQNLTHLHESRAGLKPPVKRVILYCYDHHIVA